MRRFAIALVLAFLAGPAVAQGLTGPEHRHASPGFGPPTEPPKVKVDEKAYRKAVESIPDQKVADPWQSMRDNGPARVEKKAK
jgi:hypothetical protein